MKHSIILAILLMFTGCGAMNYQPMTGAEDSKSAAVSPRKSQQTKLDRCRKPLGSVAVIEEDTPDSPAYQMLAATFGQNNNFPKSIAPLVQISARQTNCFRVIDSRRGKPRSPDYHLIPAISFTDINGGMFSMLLGGPTTRIFSGRAIASGLLSNLQYQEALVTLILVDRRTGKEIAVSQGTASKTDMAGGAFGLTAQPTNGGLGGWNETNESKIVSAAFTDAMAKLVRAVR